MKKVSCARRKYIVFYLVFTVALVVCFSIIMQTFLTAYICVMIYSFVL